MTLLAALSFDEASGAFIDATGNGHGFTPDASITRQTGHTGTGARHENTSANSPGPAIFGQTALRTMMVWVKRTSNSVDGWITEMKNVSADTGVFGFLYTGANVQARVKNSSNVATFVQVAQPTVNVWHHLCMTYDGTNLRFYIDGVLVGSPTAFTGPIWTAATLFPFFDTVGAETVIDDFRLYDEARSLAQIQTDRDTPVSAASVNSGTLTGSFSSPTAAITGTTIPKDSGTVAGSFSSPSVSLTGVAESVGNLAGTFSSPTASYDGLLSADVTLEGTFAAPTADFSVTSALPASGELAGSFSAPDATFFARSEASGVLSGSFSTPVFSVIGGIPMVNRDILVTIGPGERPATSIAAGTSHNSVAQSDFKRTEIGA